MLPSVLYMGNCQPGLENTTPTPRHPKLGMYSLLSLPYQGHDFPSPAHSEDGSWVTGLR